MFTTADSYKHILNFTIQFMNACMRTCVYTYMRVHIQCITYIHTTTYTYHFLAHRRPKDSLAALVHRSIDNVLQNVKSVCKYVCVHMCMYKTPWRRLSIEASIMSCKKSRICLLVVVCKYVYVYIYIYVQKYVYVYIYVYMYKTPCPTKHP